MTAERATGPQEEAGFKALFQSSPLGIIVSSLDGVILDVNDAVVRMFGFGREEILGRTSAEVGLIPPEVREGMFRTLRAQSAIRDSELKVKVKSGRMIDVIVSVQPVEMHDDRRYVTTFLDITARKRAEERFRALLESAPDAMVIVGGDGRICLVNAQTERMFGYMREELVGQLISKLIPERYRARHREHREAFVAAPRARPMGVGRELFALKKDGSEIPVEISLSPVSTEEDVLVAAAVRDISERKGLQARLALSDRLASVGTLAAGVAHEINNPLSYVMNNLEFLAQELREVGGASPSARVRAMLEMLGEAREGAERVRKIVRGMKIFVRADEERRELLEIPRVLEVAINMAFNEVRHRARLVKDFEGSPAVMGDESRLVQVFINLIVNAAHAISEGAAEKNEIRITTKIDGTNAVVEVRDTGRGIPPEMLGRIFDPFFTTKPVGVGVGLGLSITHGIIAGLGGEITVKSQVDVGTIMRVVIPLARVDAVPETPPLAKHVSHAPRRGRILVVDDDPMVGRSLSRVLRGHDVTTVVSGKAALDALLSGATFDVIVCDLMMPEMTGMQLHSELTTRMPNVCDNMIFVTGGAFTVAARDFLDRVPNHRFEKPFDIKAILAAVNGLLRQR
ncbi:MAG TPA: PAS domain S-box protein [Polyangiaceae bacterium]|nr:PAS domain S-box protein [Polyangiaceae bacterium]